MLENLSKWMLQGNNLAYATIGFVGIVVVFYFLYNTLSFYILKERYHGIRFTTKNIAYITMMTAISVAVTIAISITIPITVFPPVRVSFEGVMVKITGFIFGPIVGVIVGLITEMLVTIFVPSFIHPAYTITVIVFGFISGVGSSFLRAGKGKGWFIFLLIHVFIIIFGAFMTYLINSYSGNIDVLGISMTPEIYKWVFLGSLGVTLLIVWVVVGRLYIKRKAKILHTLLPIILFATACEFIASTLISSWGEAGFLGIQLGGGYTAMVISHLVDAPLKIVFNTIVLYFTYTAVKSLVKRDR